MMKRLRDDYKKKAETGALLDISPPPQKLTLSHSLWIQHAAAPQTPRRGRAQGQACGSGRRGSNPPDLSPWERWTLSDGPCLRHTTWVTHLKWSLEMETLWRTINLSYLLCGRVRARHSRCTGFQRISCRKMRDAEEKSHKTHLRSVTAGHKTLTWTAAAPRRCHCFFQ